MKKVKPNSKKRKYSKPVSLYPMKWYEALGTVLNLGEETEKKDRSKVKSKLKKY